MRRSWRTALRLPLAFSLIVGLLAAGPVAQAAQNPHERGPDPTQESIEAPTGPFEIAEEDVSRLSVDGFGGGTIYYPTDTSEGKFGAITIAPGFTASEVSLSWIGPRLASQGFVVMLINTITRADQPDSRGDQLLAALDYLTMESPVKDRIDASRLGVAGHSMGGGGTLEAALDRPELQAAVPFAPWNLNKDFSGVQVPTFIIGGQIDLIASVGLHSKPFYESLPDQNKGFMELRGAGHFFPQLPNTTMASSMISWFKRFIDDDTRYEQFLCPPPSGLGISEYLDTCPHS